MLHYYPQHVSSINMPIFRRTNCILTASGIVAVCKRLHSTPVVSGLILYYDARSKKHQISFNSSEMNSFITAKATRCRECWKDLNCSMRHKNDLLSNTIMIFNELSERQLVKLVKICICKRISSSVNVCITADVLTCVQAGNEQVKIH